MTMSASLHPAAAAPAARRRPLVPPLLTRLAVALRSYMAFAALWWGLAGWVDNPLQLPDPFRVARALVELLHDGEVLEHASVSTGRLLLSLVVAAAVAVPLGFVIGLSRRVEAFVDPLVELLRPISGIAWIPLALFIFGVGNTLPVFIMVYVAFFPLLLNTVAGVRSVDAKLLAASRTMGVARAATLRHVVVPSALPMVLVGVRLAFAGAWAAVVAAELIGSPSGLGFAIEWYRGLLMSHKVFAFIAVIGVVGFICDALLRSLQRRLTPWVEVSDS
jgi:ABC-type nitrate/sulfonate/bicarbonate transport system permease component